MTRNFFCSGSSDGLWLARLYSTQGRLLVLTQAPDDAQRLREEVAWFAPECRILQLPDWETLPYDQFSPHQDLVSERLTTLWQMLQGQWDIVVVPVVTALGPLPPTSHLLAHTFFLRRGDTLDPSALRSQLIQAGYQAVPQVTGPGEYAVRGGLIDLFPMGHPVPFRIELLDQEVDTLRTFDVDTQRTLYPVQEIRLLPARELPMDDAGRLRFRENFRERFEGDPSRCALYREVGAGVLPPGAEYYLPLFFQNYATLFDYLPPQTTVCLHHDPLPAIRAFWNSTQTRWKFLAGDRTRPVLDPAELFLNEERLFIALKSYPVFRINQHQPADRLSSDSAAPTPHPADEFQDLPDLTLERRALHPLARLQRFCRESIHRVLIVAESPGRREVIEHLLSTHGLKPCLVNDWKEAEACQEPLALTISPLACGFIWRPAQLNLVTESDLYSTPSRSGRRREPKSTRAGTDSLIRDLCEIMAGDPVVHLDHGIGRFAGLVTLDTGGGSTEFLELRYAQDDKLFVPVTQLHLISRYSGGPAESAPLHRLGSGQWEKARRRAALQARDSAAHLLDLYARRAARPGFEMSWDEEQYNAFALEFEYEETADQAAAIAAVLSDMRSGKAMDRLICGDVGFGKTEVALRAAFVAVQAGRQVALLVPTTLLAEQHFQTFCDRFARWPVRIAELSRFRSGKENAQTLQEIAAGTLDIVIGTHKLITDRINFARLGLVIIDEEHRFGVRQKEKLKALRSAVDVLTLTATPIPRTLAFSLEGLRDFSIIATAPQKRLAIKTLVYPESDSIIREAALRELKRGGQIYFLYNEVETMERMHDRLLQLLPEARIAVAHGQMHERELERVMRGFYHHNANLLLCSTIIETGIDVPRANTILIHRADRFGLAQLHQLRGRVGRSHHQAFAYLLTPPAAALTAPAQKRLEAIQAMEELGAGFYLALQDMEIRGAGEVLGEAQSGEIQEIGFALYGRMLDRAIQALRRGDASGQEDLLLDPATEVNLHTPALLPADYCDDIHERLVLYKRLAACASEAELSQLQDELLDRFGALPPATVTLLWCHNLRVWAQRLGIQRLDLQETQLTVHFTPQTPLNPEQIIQWVLEQPKNYRLLGPDRLRIHLEGIDLTQRAQSAALLLRSWFATLSDAQTAFEARVVSPA